MITMILSVFTDEETDVEELNNLPNGTQLVSGES